MPKVQATAPRPTAKRDVAGQPEEHLQPEREASVLLPATDLPLLPTVSPSALTHVHIENFQSLKEADLELGPLTMLVGAGNVGKSAVVRAITAALTNASGDDFVRKGTTEALVVLTFGDGTVLEWRKAVGKGGVYFLNGETYSRTRGDLPEPVREFLKVSEVEIDSTYRIRPQIQDQFDGPFIVGESGSRIARVFGRLTRLDVVVTAQMEARRELSKAQAQARAAAEEAERLAVSLAALPDISEIRERQGEAERALRDARHKLQAAETARQLVPLLVRARRVSSLSVELVRDDLSLLQAVVARIEQVRQLATDLTRARSKAESMWAEEAHAKYVLSGIVDEYEAECRAQNLCLACPYKMEAAV